MSLRDYWPEFLVRIREFGLLADTEDAELETLKSAIDGLLDDQFIETSTEQGIARREAILNIVPYGDDTLEDRRFRVSGAWMNRLPYSMRMLRERLDALLGAEKYEIEINQQPYTLRVKIELVAKRQFDAAAQMLREIAPANLVLSVELRYNQHMTLERFTHGQLTSYTHNDLREEALT